MSKLFKNLIYDKINNIKMKLILNKLIKSQLCICNNH